MALSSDESRELIGTLFRAARDVDPSLHDRLEKFFEPEGEPIANLERCIRAFVQIVRCESRQGYAVVTGQLRDFIEVEGDGVLSEVIVRLTGEEQYLYNTPIIRFADLPDMEECLEYLALALGGIHD